MKTYARILVVLFAGVLLAACSPARTGVVNGVLTTNQRPAISIAANAPFALADSGRLWVSPRTLELPGAVDASFDYAVYTDAAASPAAKFAYAAIIRLEEMQNWHFAPQGNTLPGSFGLREKVEPVSREGMSYTLHVPAAGDWASELLAANGTAVPEAWIARRWLFSVDQGVRAMAEYREPWPADFAVPTADIMLLRESHAAFLRDFETRARAAFSFADVRGDFPDAPPVSTWKRAPVAPDVKTLAGDIIFIDNHNSFD